MGVSWDLFFGAYHFCSLRTVDLAKKNKKNAKSTVFKLQKWYAGQKLSELWTHLQHILISTALLERGTNLKKIYINMSIIVRT